MGFSDRCPVPDGDGDIRFRTARGGRRDLQRGARRRGPGQFTWRWPAHFPPMLPRHRARAGRVTRDWLVRGGDAVPLGSSKRAFAAATARLGRRQVGPWADRDAVLHAEVRAILLGRSVPGDTDSIPAGDLVRLSYTAYRDRRADDGVGRAAASALLKVAGAVEPDAFARIFPELAAATAAIARLRDDELPEGFDKIDRVVVDEVQDLTVLETAVVVEPLDIWSHGQDSCVRHNWPGFVCRRFGCRRA